ncbi:hypothetical protein C8F04DRAFT_995702 [Mycena alexandri]|uniref:CST complex subunit STN1 n=1 Tax=Mycena alexandri TaxID=1745969 RepID=A0AAD6TB20_9AGAR|nr:hypothetical protein C8F04DRAFT_995702 [Mycena alexandri]
MASTSNQRLESVNPPNAVRQVPDKHLWQWTFTPEAVAPCFVKDVFEMPKNGDTRDAEFFWLGRVPCRTVKLVGWVAGVQPYEKRVVYYLDDGTSVIECHHRPPAENIAKDKATVANPEPLPLLKPLAYVGSSVVVIGRILPWHDTRRILVDSLVKCPSSNDEPRHWIAVRALHERYYFIDEPFVIPPKPSAQMPSKPLAISVPSSPSSSIAPSRSPSKSPTKSPHKLRHPSRLHTKDLTGNAFRIYLKHYMDNADDFQPVAPEPTTPTKSSRNVLPPADETPRPHDHTPRRITPLDFTRPLTPVDQTRGFTLSYLRRVPELSLMAKRVVKAEAKRRARDARDAQKKAKEGGAAKKPVVTKAMSDDKQKLHPRMKRLFGWAILELVKAGDVITWDGPARPCPRANEGLDADTSALWRFNTSSSTVGGNSTMFSSASIAEDDDDEGELTDPGEDEEAFISLTPAFLATAVEQAISKFIARSTVRAQSSKEPMRSRGGPKLTEITSFLKNGDDMWRNLTEFSVEEALALLQKEGRAWVQGGRWELTL